MGNPHALESIDEILHRVVAGLGLEKRLKEHTLMNLYQTFMDPRLSAKSYPLFIDAENNLVVAVANASVSQELSLMKPQILKKLLPIASSLAITLQGLRFDLKQYKSLDGGVSPVKERNYTCLPVPTSADLDAVLLPESDQGKIKELACQLASEGLSARIAGMFERQLKLSLWRRAHGYPVCHLCNTPVSRLIEFINNNNLGGLCSLCFLQDADKK